MVHPDPGTSGACLETKRIADYAYRNGINTMIHMAGSPVGTLAAAHSAATYENFLAMECHALDFLDWWQKLVIILDAQLVRLDIDFDNDGMIDEIVDTTWAELLAQP